MQTKALSTLKKLNVKTLPQPTNKIKWRELQKKSLENWLLGKVAKFFTYFIFSKVRKKSIKFRSVCQLPIITEQPIRNNKFSLQEAALNINFLLLLLYFRAYCYITYFHCFKIYLLFKEHAYGKRH